MQSVSNNFSLYTRSGIFFCAVCLVTFFLVPPFEDIHYPQVFVVSKGETIRAIADDLRDRKVIISPSLFILSNYIAGNKILFGSYHFLKPRGVFSIASEFYTGDTDAPLKRILIPEGSNLYAIADVFEKTFNNFDREAFLDLALEQHGYLYPDTYLFSDTEISERYLVEIMTETFRRRTSDIFASYTGPLSRNEIVTLASIVELEASRHEDRRRIAGVLFNRLEMNYPLQVDVSFLFISGKHTFTLSRSDLKTDDPSNTYKYAGIPPIPISNPSKDSIEAVINPIKSNDIFFLADFYGNTHFSETYEQHLVKKQRYITSVINNQLE